MIQLTIAWTCVGVFVATAVITLLALLGIIKLADKKYLDRLVKVLIVQVCIACVGMFTGQIELPSTVERRIEESAEEKTLRVLEPKIVALNKDIELREAMVQAYLKKVPSGQVTPADRQVLDRPLRFDLQVLKPSRQR